MEKQLKIRYFRMSTAVYLLFIIFAFTGCIILACLHVFGRAEWLLLLLFFLIMLLPLVFGYETVHLDKEQIRVCLFGLTVRAIPTEELRILCAVGNNSVSTLCLSAHSYEKAVELQAARMQRSALRRGELPFADRDKLVQEYFKRFLRFAFGPFAEQKTVFLPMDTALLHLLRELYPQLPYHQLAELPRPEKVLCVNEDRAVAFDWSVLYPYTVALSEDGIALTCGKKALFSLPAKAIRTVMFLDCFFEASRQHPRRRSLIFVSTEPVEALAAKVKKPVFGLAPETLSPALLAEFHAKDYLLKWSRKDQTCCYLLRSDSNASAVQRLYPGAQLIDCSAEWRKDRCAD